MLCIECEKRIPDGYLICPFCKKSQGKSEKAHRVKIAAVAVEWRMAELYHLGEKIHPSAPVPNEPADVLDELRAAVDAYLEMTSRRGTVSFTYYPHKR